MSGTKRYTPYIEEQKKIQQLKLNHYKTALNAVDPHPIPSIDVVTLPKWDEMTDDDKVAESKRLCAAVEEKLSMRPPKIAEKMAERIHIGATTYSNYRRGICVLSSQRRRRGSYSCVREILAVYLNTGDVNNLELPRNDQRQEQHDKAISECVRLDKRIDFVDKAVNKRCYEQDELIIKLHQRLDGLAEANKLLLQKLEATTEPAPPTELAQWWDRLWSR